MNMQKEVYYDINEYGEETEVEKPTNSSIARIIVVNKNTGKGIKDSVRKKLTFNDHKDCLQKLEPLYKQMNTIKSDHHNVYTHSMKKIALSVFDNKRWIQDDGVSTYAHGHYKT